jgi:hypothetical protein
MLPVPEKVISPVMNEFEGDIFDGFSDEKAFLVKSLIELNGGSPVKRTKLLYSFPKFK